MKCLFKDCDREAEQGFPCCGKAHGFAVKTWRETLQMIADPSYKISDYCQSEEAIMLKDYNLTFPIGDFEYYYNVLT